MVRVDLKKPAGRTQPAGSIHSAGYATSSSMPGRRLAASAPRGEHGMVTRPEPAAMARTAGPRGSTSPALSRRATSDRGPPAAQFRTPSGASSLG
jgi:hypothetical protein